MFGINADITKEPTLKIVFAAAYYILAGLKK